MQIIIDLSFSVPIWKFFYVSDNNYKISYEFIYKDKIHTNGICIFQFGWDVDENRLINDKNFLNEIFVQNARNIILCAPNLTTSNLLKKYRPNLRSCLADHNAFIDESVYKIDYSVQPKFDLIVSSSFCKYKNLNLVKKLNNICSIGYFQGNDTSEILEEKNVYFPNFEDRERTRKKFVWIDPITFCKYYNMRKIGGIFSTIEGACFSSSEYLLCGLPVLSCMCVGGREIWYTDENSVLCDPNENSVVSSLHSMLTKYNNGYYDREKIRQHHIELMDFHRNNLTNEVVKLLQMITLVLPPFDELKYSLKYYHSNCFAGHENVSINYKKQILNAKSAREMIKINIFLAIYTYNKSFHRFKLTEKIFKHYKNIVEHFKDSAIFSFTILGSEGDISRNLSLKYFKESEYFEFNQNDPKFTDFMDMLSHKVRTGMQISASMNADILFWAGSNDYICYDFFKQVIEYYNPEKPQVYGIDNYYNGKSAVFFTHYDGYKDETNQFCLTANNRSSCYWWNGVSNYSGRGGYKYCGGIIGINARLAFLQPDIINYWSADEGQVEEYILSKPNIDKFTSTSVFYLNIKTLDKTEINSFQELRMLNEKTNDILNFVSFSEEFKNKFIEEFNSFSKLHV